MSSLRACASCSRGPLATGLCTATCQPASGRATMAPAVGGAGAPAAGGSCPGPLLCCCCCCCFWLSFDSPSCCSKARTWSARSAKDTCSQPQATDQAREAHCAVRQLACYSLQESPPSSSKTRYAPVLHVAAVGTALSYSQRSAVHATSGTTGAGTLDTPPTCAR